jgi:hypothetical protein
MRTRIRREPDVFLPHWDRVVGAIILSLKKARIRFGAHVKGLRILGWKLQRRRKQRVASGIF